MEDECLDSGGSFNENGICNIAGSHQDVPLSKQNAFKFVTHLYR